MLDYRHFVDVDTVGNPEVELVARTKHCAFGVSVECNARTIVHLDNEPTALELGHEHAVGVRATSSGADDSPDVAGQHGADDSARDRMAVGGGNLAHDPHFLDCTGDLFGNLIRRILAAEHSTQRDRDHNVLHASLHFVVTHQPTLVDRTKDYSIIHRFCQALYGNI